MAFPSFPFPPSTLLYPPAKTVLRYLEDYASHFHVAKHVKVSTTVHSIDWDSGLAQWRVRTQATNSGGPVEESLFDLLIIANGHYRVPLYPTTPGLEAWVKSGKATHAAWYRHAHNVGDTVMVVGRGPSGIDVADEMRTVCKTLIHSFPGAKHTDLENGALKLRGRIVEFLDASEGTIRFEDGTTETNIDHCILATGYEHSLPFLPSSLLELALPPPIPPLPEKLYNSKVHIFPLAKQMFPLVTSFPPSSLALLVLPYRIIPFPLAEAQTRAVLKAFAEPASLDPAAEAVDIVSRYQMLREIVGDDERAIARLWHHLEDEQFEYRDDLHQFAGGAYAGPEWKVPEWVVEIWEQKITLRNEWKDLVKAGEAEDWVRGVGEAGGEEGELQWIEMMRRLVKRAEDRKVTTESAKMNRL